MATPQEPHYTHPDREFSWRLTQEGDEVTVVIKYRGFPDDQGDALCVRALDILQRCAAPRAGARR